MTYQDVYRVRRHLIDKFNSWWRWVTSIAGLSYLILILGMPTVIETISDWRILGVFLLLFVVTILTIITYLAGIVIRTRYIENKIRKKYTFFIFPYDKRRTA
jgi:hypothetical protein